MSPRSVPVDFTKPIDRSKIKDKTALITGGASGIGAGTARALAEAGAYVVIADINRAASEQLREDLVKEGFKAHFVHVDVTQWTSQVQAFKSAIEHSPTKSIDVVVACAGISAGPMLQDAPFTTPDDSSDDPAPPKNQIAMINVNLVGAIYTSTLAIHYWRRNQQPNPDNTLLIVASNIAYFPPPGFTGYAASKWGLRGFWKSLRGTPEFSTLFRTNLLAPHLTRSPMTAALQPICDEYGLKMTEVEDCVECLMRLCCDAGVRGRAVQVNPEGSWFDLCDDFEGFEGVRVGREHDHETRPLFDLLSPEADGS